MLRYGIPDYRLPQDVLDRDITHILSTGITVRTAVSIGQDVAIEEIQKDYDAVYIASVPTLTRSWAWRGRSPPM